MHRLYQSWQRTDIGFYAMVLWKINFVAFRLRTLWGRWCHRNARVHGQRPAFYQQGDERVRVSNLLLFSNEATGIGRERNSCSNKCEWTMSYASIYLGRRYSCRSIRHELSLTERSSVSTSSCPSSSSFLVQLEEWLKNNNWASQAINGDLSSYCDQWKGYDDTTLFFLVENG